MLDGHTVAEFWTIANIISFAPLLVCFMMFNNNNSYMFPEKLRKNDLVFGRLMSLSPTYFQRSAMAATGEWRNGL